MSRLLSAWQRLRTPRDPPSQTRLIPPLGRAVRLAVGLVVATVVMVGVGRPDVSLGGDGPTAAGFTFQTSGPNAPVTVGDWYSSTVAGAGSGYHYLAIDVPCGWPAATPLYIDIYSPEMNRVSGALGGDEEPRGNYDSTQFELYPPGTAVGPGAGLPAPGTGIAGTRITYQPGLPGVGPTWVRYATLLPALCGRYLLRSAVLANDPANLPGEGNDDNGWHVRIGTDNDADPTNAPPANASDPDGVPGSNDEPLIGIEQVTFQQSTGAVACITLYQHVDAGLPSVTFNNFDMDGNTRLKYYAPSDTVDPSGVVGGTAGTMSSDSSWNGDGITRAGDTIPNPEAGWWAIVTCVSSTNQFIQDRTPNQTAFFAQPPTPVLAATKDDGVSTATRGQTLTYAIGIANTSSGATAGAANAVVVTDPLPAGLTFVSCAFQVPAIGTCTQIGGTVTASLTGWINAGSSATLHITVVVAAGAVGPLTNVASVTYEDGLGNAQASVSASDTDAVNISAPSPTPTPTPSATSSPSPTPLPAAPTPAAPSPSIPNTSFSAAQPAGLDPAGFVVAVMVLAVALAPAASRSLRRRRNRA